MKIRLKLFSNIVIIMFFCVINMSVPAKSMDIDINNPFFTCFDLELKNGEIIELHNLKVMFEDLKHYLNEPKNPSYKSRSCILNIGSEFKYKFSDMSRLDLNDNDEMLIEVHNYIRFLNIFCKDIIIPIHAKIYKPAFIHDKTYSILNEISKNIVELIKIIENKYSESIKYSAEFENSTIIVNVHRTYYLYIEPIYTQLKKLQNILRPYKFKSIYFIGSPLIQF